MLNFNEMLKGSMGATDVAFNGTLTPQKGRTLVKAIVDRSGFLKKITVDIASGLKKQRETFDINKGILTRHVPGQAVPESAMKKISSIGCMLNMTNGVTLNAKILDETIEDNRDNPNFEQEIFASFAKSFANELTYLGFVGVADDENITSDFKNLSKGWIQVASESSASNKIIVAKTLKVTDNLTKLVENLHEDIKNSATILMSGVDYTNYQLEVAEKFPTSGVLVTGGVNSFLGNAIEVVDNLSQGTMLATLLPNVIFGISSKIDKKRWYDNETSSLRYKFVAYCDFEFDIHKYVTLLTTAE